MKGETMKATKTPHLERRHHFLGIALFAFGLVVLWSAWLQPAQAQAPAPLYTRKPVQQASTTNLNTSDIDLSIVPHLTSIYDTAGNFDGRTAAAVFQACSIGQKNGLATGGLSKESLCLATFAYGDYFNDPVGSAVYRSDASAYVIANYTPGKVGTHNAIGPIDFGGDYDMGLPYLITLYYRYYNEMQETDPHLGDYLLNTLFNVRGMLGGHEEEWVSEGDYKAGFPEWIDKGFISIPETENHLLAIETERYLINQLLYQQTHDDQYDNLRNGRDSLNQCVYGCDNYSTTEWLLRTLAGKVRRDFLEYNARPYEDQDMAPLLDLCTYAYDDRVRLAARMVLDYISAKVAVSSNDLRRVLPFRRRNEDEYYGPSFGGGFLGSPLLYQPDNSSYKTEPQTVWYCMLAGNTEMYALNTGSDKNPLGTNLAPWEMASDMVQAGLCDYRVPPSILDLFVTAPHRRFYQRFHHNTDTPTGDSGIFADELYAGSPSYLITAGGHPTPYCYVADQKAGLQALYDGLGSFLGGVVGVVLADWVDSLIHPNSSDLGVAVPTTFMPSLAGTNLLEMIQFGTYTVSGPAVHMGVAPDFACGGPIYIPPEFANDRTVVTDGNWTFIDRSGAPGQPGCYLALYQQDVGGEKYGFLEAYDTWLHPGAKTFLGFIFDVTIANGNSINLNIGNGQINNYVTESGQVIQFTISPDEIVSTSEVTAPPGYDYKSDFTFGTILSSPGQDVGYITIANPSLGTQITLDYSDVHNPVRTDESGTQQRGGQEVWVDFNPNNYPDKPEVGDFGDPFWTLGDAVNGVTTSTLDSPGVPVGGTVELEPGTSPEPVPLTISKPVTIRAPGGPATVGVVP
jgi:hypothetical protein